MKAKIFYKLLRCRFVFIFLYIQYIPIQYIPIYVYNIYNIYVYIYLCVCVCVCVCVFVCVCVCVDTNDFINNSNNFAVPPNSPLAKMDVKSLYTSILNNEGIV